MFYEEAARLRLLLEQAPQMVQGAKSGGLSVAEERRLKERLRVLEADNQMLQQDLETAQRAAFTLEERCAC